MTKINYYDGEKYVEIEVTEDIAKAYAELSQEERRAHWREEKHPINSLDEMLELGEEIADGCDFTEAYIDEEELKELRQAMKLLLPTQKDLIRRFFFKGQALKEIAEEYGISYQAVQNRLKKILEKLRKKI